MRAGSLAPELGLRLCLFVFVRLISNGGSYEQVLVSQVVDRKLRRVCCGGGW